MAKKLAITLKRSLIGRGQSQQKTVEALGLKRMHQTVIQNDNEAIRGMINKVNHLLEVKETEA
jgi:large subunit ribosomal protein L30